MSKTGHGSSRRSHSFGDVRAVARAKARMSWKAALVGVRARSQESGLRFRRDADEDCPEQTPTLSTSPTTTPMPPQPATSTRPPASSDAAPPVEPRFRGLPFSVIQSKLNEMHPSKETSLPQSPQPCKASHGGPASLRKAADDSLPRVAVSLTAPPTLGNAVLGVADVAALTKLSEEAMIENTVSQHNHCFTIASPNIVLHHWPGPVFQSSAGAYAPCAPPGPTRVQAVRFSRDEIYSAVGTSLLIAVNPHQRLSTGGLEDASYGV